MFDGKHSRALHAMEELRRFEKKVSQVSSERFDTKGPHFQGRIIDGELKRIFPFLVASNNKKRNKII